MYSWRQELSRGTGVRESIYLSIYGYMLNMSLSKHVKHVFIKALQIKTRRKFELRLSTSVHLLENVNRFQGFSWADFGAHYGPLSQLKKCVKFPNFQVKKSQNNK